LPGPFSMGAPMAKRSNIQTPSTGE
jgi:hypothetical protein